ncbi:MAG: SatD family protein [Candidatus Binatota bacterium]
MMPKHSRAIAVITGDVIGSSRYSASAREKLDRLLRQAFADAERRFPRAIHTRMAFRITAGDEFQCVISEIPRAFDILTYVRAVAAGGGLDPPVRFRASVGVGELSTPKRTSPYEQDGTAFVRAREGLEDMAKDRNPVRWTKLRTDSPEIDEPVDAVLCLADYLEQSWTVPQWEAVRWSILGLTRKEIAKKLGIAHQNVTKRLLAAGWPHFEIAVAFLRSALGQLSGTPRRVQQPLAPN